MEEARTCRRRETGAAVARPSTEPEYAGQISVQCELRLVREFHASRFITVDRRGERLGTVVIAVFEVGVRFHVAVVFHHQYGVWNVVPVVPIVYLCDTFPISRETYATW